MPFWLTLLIMVALTVLSELIRPKPKFENAKPAGLGDFQFPTATEARRQPLVWGTVQIKGPNVIWYGDLKVVAITKKIKTGLFSSTTIITGYKYYVGVQFAICRGEVDFLSKLWIEEDLVQEGTEIGDGDVFTIDKPDIFGGDELGNGGFIGTFEFFAGTTTATPSTYLRDFQDEGGATPAYRKVTYLAPEVEAPYVGNSTSIKPWRFEVQRITNAGANLLGLADPTVNGKDANPANVLYEVMTETEWGMKFAAAGIDETSFTVAAATLQTEGNGFSFILDRPEDTSAMFDRLLEQIDGLVVRDHGTGKWKLKLARDDYDVDTIEEFDDSNIVEIEAYSAGTWERTSNIFSLEFIDRDDEYKTTYATAQDMANIRIKDNQLSPVTQRYSGVKDATLANSLVWRLLRTLSRPLIQARIATTRATYAVEPLDVVKVSFTRGPMVVEDLLMRVSEVDLGRLEEGVIVYDLTQDIFRSAIGSFGDPGGSGWSPPEDDIVAFPADEQMAIEAPRMLTARDVAFPFPEVDVVLAAARKQGPEGLFEMVARWSSGTPSGDYLNIGSSARFALIGNLNANLSIGSAVPLSTITINTSPDSEEDILAAFPDISGASELGVDLLSLILVGDEWMLPLSASAGAGTDVDFDDVYRGVGDSVQSAHTAGDPVWLIYAGAGMSSSQVPPGYNADIKLLPRTLSLLLDESSATAIAIDFDFRTRRPYPPSEMDLDGIRFKSTVGLESGGTGEDDGIVIDFLRRDFRNGNEVESLETDAGSLYSDFPSANSTTHEVEVVNDPDGTPTSLFTHDLGSVATGEVRRLEILKETAGVLPTRLRFRLRAVHLFDAVSYDSLVDLVWDFNVTSTLTGDFNFGALDTGDDSNEYTADATGVLSFTLSTAFATGDVQYRVDTGGGYGSWLQLIAATGTNGATPSLAIGDKVQVQHLSSVADSLKLLTMTSGGTDGYAVLFV